MVSEQISTLDQSYNIQWGTRRTASSVRKQSLLGQYHQQGKWPSILQHITDLKLQVQPKSFLCDQWLERRTHREMTWRQGSLPEHVSALTSLFPDLLPTPRPASLNTTALFDTNLISQCDCKRSLLTAIRASLKVNEQPAWVGSEASFASSGSDEWPPDAKSYQQRNKTRQSLTTAL